MKPRKRTEFESLDVVRLARGEWRVSDAADPDILLGFIERQAAGRFEVVWMTDPMRWGYADSFDAALVAFGDSVRFSGEVLPQRARAVERGTDMFGLARGTARPRRSTWVKSGDHSSVA